MCDSEYIHNDRSAVIAADITIEWSNAEVIAAVITKVAEMIHEDIRPEVEKTAINAVNDAVNKAIQEVMESEVQPVDRWGKPTEQAASIRELLMREVSAWLMESVDEKGRKGKDSYGQRDRRIYWLFKQALDGEKDAYDRRKGSPLRRMVIDAVKDTIGDVEAVVNETVRQQVADVLAKGADK